MNTDPGIADLLRQLRDDTTGLVREEIQLAKTEAGEKARRVGRNLGFLLVAGLIGSSALLLLLVGAAFLLAEAFAEGGMDPGVATFLGFLTVALAAGVAAGVLATKGLSALSNESAIPNRTARSLKEDKQWAQNKLS
jgi:hypothetical protein